MAKDGKTPYERYVESGIWKCAKSPTGAHHWVEVDHQQKEFVCKYCQEVRKFQTAWEGSVAKEYVNMIAVTDLEPIISMRIGQNRIEEELNDGVDNLD